MLCYGILEFNVPLDTVQVISETGALSSDVHLSFSNGGPATPLRKPNRGEGIVSTKRKAEQCL